MTFEVMIGWLATVLTAAQFIPQAVRAVRSDTMEGVSRATFMMVLITSLLWLLHGANEGDRYLMITNACTFIAGAIVVWRSFVVARKII